MKNKLFCVIIPAYNEEKVIKQSICALKKVVSKKDIFVVSDGSVDQTVKLARLASVYVLALRKNRGKAKAIFELITKKKLTDKYQYVLFSDADSQLDKNFIKAIRETIKQNPACIVGTVISQKHGLISAFRTYEYGLTHLIFKNAQNAMQTITVAPGCASLYRSDILKQLDFSKNTLTEDFDLTLQIHHKKLGKIIYVSKAKVITQDPPTLKDYWNQVLRWYTGFWQNIFLHKLYLPIRKINLEIHLLILDASAGIGSIVYFAFYPDLFLRLLFSMVITFIILSGIVITIQKKFWGLIYTPLFPILYFINLLAYITGFFRALFFKNKVLSWRKVSRYYAKA